MRVVDWYLSLGQKIVVGVVVSALLFVSSYLAGLLILSVAGVWLTGVRRRGILRTSPLRSSTNSFGVATSPKDAIVAAVRLGGPANHGAGAEALNRCLLISSRENEQHKLYGD